ncbi:MAG: hypothetical protein JWM53_3347, partial [bacterium]|nr:hypothetical protein [bacterium]
MPAVRNPNRDDHTPVDVHAELDRIRLERNAREAHDGAASERAARSEANDRAAELQRQRLATLTPFNQLIGAEGEEVLAAFERELKERKWNAMLARHIILPHLRRRGDGEMFVAYEDWDASVGAAVTSLMPLADAGLLLSEQSPALLVPKKKLAWEKVQAERRAAEEQQRRLQESSRRLDARRAAKAKEVRDLGQARAALILTAHELEQR